jgi:hypothetical protein
MALVNPNIAMSYRQPDIQAPNALAQFAQVQQIQNSQLQNQLARNQLEQEEGVMNYLRGGSNLATPEGRAGLRQFGKTGLAYEKLLSEQETAALKRQELEGKVRDQRMQALGIGLSSTKDNPTDEALAAAFDRLDSTGIDTKSFRQQFANIQDIDQRKGLLNQYVYSNPEARQAVAFVQPKPMQITRGDGRIVFLDQNPASPTFQQEVMPAQEAGMTPAQIEQNRIAQQQLGVSQGQLGVAQRNADISAARLQFDKAKAEQPQFNAQAGGFIAPPTKENPDGVFIPAKGIQAAKDQSAAVKALQSAGYNVETGEDNISKLIAKSTSGGLEAGTAAALAFFGKSTEGRKAIAALEGTANQIATDLAGGKLGAGISNTDRDFIVGALGDVSNPNKTSEERLAGWNAAKQRMMLTGLVPVPKTTPAAAGAPAVAPVKITGDADYNKLPPGSLFIAPDGSQRRKP